MHATKTLIDRYGERMLAVIEESPQEAMAAIAEWAESQGFVHSTTDLRADNPVEFVMDVWTENPVVPDRLNLYLETLPSPSQISDLAAILDLFQ